MRSKTSFFNFTAFRKNLTRFAPVWGGYTLCLLLGMILLLGGDVVYWFPAHFAELVNIMVIVNLGYALLVAQLLFGDLYNTRMCNALHAMPLRRECWFATNAVSGFAFSLLPTVIFAVVSIFIISGFSVMENGWQLPLYWLLANTLQYTFFFGAAVFSTFCTGSRVGMAVIYAILNFFSYLAYFLLDTVYEPMLHGVILQHTVFQLLCPTAHIANTQFIKCTRHNNLIGYTADGHEQYDIYGTFQLTGNWSYLWIIAGVGLVFGLIALVMYRRRRLECAGDVIATKKLEPAFMILFSLAASVVVYFVASQILGYGSNWFWLRYLLLFSGLAIGWFAGRMLLERQANVFRRGKNWLGLILLAAVFGLSMYINTLDPFGIVTWTPETEDVAQVEFGMGWRGQVTTDDPEEIADAIRLHELALEDMLTSDEISQARAEAAAILSLGNETLTSAQLEDAAPRSCSFSVNYVLKSGWQVQREYFLWIDSEAGELLNKYTSSVEAVFYDQYNIRTAEELLRTAKTPEKLLVQGVPVDEALLTEETVEALFRAVIADCEAGTMTQYYEFHPERVIDEETLHLNSYDVEVILDSTDKDLNYCYFDIYADSENCMAWVESLGILEEVKQIVSGYYG